MKTYFQHIKEGIRTTVAGMKLTLKHLWAARTRRNNNNVAGSDYFNEQNGMVTLQYPFETMPIPDNGRYRLNNEMDDCIVCDKCAKVCPVDCIDIEPIKATGEVGKASDGSPIRLYAAKFDIDMAKCCYCGLCTTVCPTECLTMTKTFDYSEFDVHDMNYHYANLTPEQAEEKKALYDQFVKEKEELKKQGSVHSPEAAVAARAVSFASDHIPEPTEAKPKPAFKPTIKPPIPKTEEVQLVETAIKKDTSIEGQGAKPKPVFAPKKPSSQPITENEENTEDKKDTPIGGQGAKPKPVFKPTKPKTVTDLVQPPISEPEETTKVDAEPAARPKPIFKPTMKPKAIEEKAAKVLDIEPEPNLQKENTDSGEAKPRPKPVFKPTMRPKKEE